MPTSTLLQRLIPLLLGASLVFAYAPFGQAWITIPVMALLILFTSQHNARQAFRIGFFFGFGWFAAGLSWIYVSIDRFGGLAPIASIALLALLFAYLSLFPALALWLWRRIGQRFNTLALGLVPLLWLLAESARGWLFTGFPWLELGYSQTDSWLGQYAPWLGGSGITLVMWLVVISLISWWQQRRWYQATFAALLLTLPFALPWLHPSERSDDSIKVLLVQGNIDQSIKWNPEQHWPTMLHYLNLSKPHYASHDLIIWPEAAVTMPEPYTDDILANIHSATADEGVALITGIIDFRGGQYFNSLITLGQDGADAVAEAYFHGHSNRYQKHQLLPIGEFVPFEDLLRPLAPLFDLPMSSFARGNAVQANLQAAGHQFAAAICYEVVFPDLLRSNITPATDFILTVSNDTWFGASHGPAQHMQIARMRALEFARPLLRATNNGISAVVDEHGHELARAEQFVATSISAEVPLVRGDTNFYRYGMWPTWLFALLFALISIFNVVKRRQNQ
ncbi:apolipoprotein N-acyltransferase [Pseudidiomarina mangrovi]|uniref:apolipoprotein N-acyltransferase n=1 Tax=Pseudidiomarina mangrovi TaxID=2487133 RepID=UPI000FCA0C07|nr:apolipoprotein N-acyltransferase [Pseudidiomarina mangrovi]